MFFITRVEILHITIIIILELVVTRVCNYNILNMFFVTKTVKFLLLKRVDSCILKDLFAVLQIIGLNFHRPYRLLLILYVAKCISLKCIHASQNICDNWLYGMEMCTYSFGFL